MAAVEASETTSQKPLEQSGAYWEPKLDELGLSVQKLSAQTPDELRVSLEKINYFISHPEQVGSASGSVNLKFFVFDLQSKAVDVIPILLERKAFVLDRLRIIEEEAKIHTLRDFMAKKIIDTETRREIEDILKQSSPEISEDSHALLQKQNSIVLERERHVLQMESLERRSKVWLAFLVSKKSRLRH